MIKYSSNGRKRCKTCRRFLALNNFHRDSQKIDGYYSRCKKCRQPSYQQWSKARNPRAAYDRKLRMYYGITVIQYDAMLASQGGACAICRDPLAVSKHGLLCVDHDHSC